MPDPTDSDLALDELLTGYGTAMRERNFTVAFALHDRILTRLTTAERQRDAMRGFVEARMDELWYEELLDDYEIGVNSAIGSIRAALAALDKEEGR